MRWSARWEGGSAEGTLMGQEMKLLRIGERAHVEVTPERGFDVGAGPGVAVRREVRGGSVGLILDGRGRPLSVPGGADGRRLVAAWARALELHPD
jgi:hypothetical protein